ICVAAGAVPRRAPPVLAGADLIHPVIAVVRAFGRRESVSRRAERCRERRPLRDAERMPTARDRRLDPARRRPPDPHRAPRLAWIRLRPPIPVPRRGRFRPPLPGLVRGWWRPPLRRQVRVVCRPPLPVPLRGRLRRTDRVGQRADERERDDPSGAPHRTPTSLTTVPRSSGT